MKAKDYYEKYHDGILSPPDDGGLRAIADFLNEMVKETGDLLEARKIRTASGLVGVVREMEQKYMAVLAMFEKNDGIRPLVDGGYMTALQIVAPSIKAHLEAEKEQRQRRMSRFGRQTF